MKVYEIREFGVDKLSLADRPAPAPESGEVLVKFHAASLNYRDIMIVSGSYNPKMKLPTIPISDGAGEITAVGDGVTKWKVGDRVMPIFAQRWFDGDSSEEKRKTSLGASPDWDGVLREFGTFSQESVVAIPEDLSYEEAATLPCAGITAWNAIAVSGRLKPGDSVLTLGTGGVSIFAIQFAKLFGARVISTSGSAEKIGKLHTDLGVAETVNYREHEDWDKAVLEIVSKPGVDHVVEVGGAGTLNKSINAVRIGGHIGLIGALTGAAGFSPTAVFMKSIRLQGIYTGSRAMFEDMNKAITVNKLKPVIDRVFEFDEIGEALKYMESGSHFGKIVVRIG